MKKTLGLLILVLLVGAVACIRYVPYGGPVETYPVESPYDRYDRYDGLDVGYFYDYLSPHGLWVSYRPYGYVWVPANVGYSWRPYTRGYWVWTDYGWTWVSLERWGWIAFHYGRWGWDRRLGWFWVPDTVWGPAWVAWRWGDAHIGWAPLPPGVDFVPGRGFGRHAWNIPGPHWSFVRGRYFMDRTLDRWILPVERNVTIVNLTSLTVNIDDRDRRVVNVGPDVDLVRRMSGRTVERYSVREAVRPGDEREDGRELVISKPAVTRNEAARPKQVLDEEAAERRLSGEPGRLYRAAPRGEEEVLREEHAKEQWLMRESQETELGEVRRRVEEDRLKAANPEDKRRLEDQSASRIAELKKKHDQEKAELEKRQKAEEAKAKKPPVRKKVEKTEKTDKAERTEKS